MCFIGNTQQLVSTLKYHMGEELLVSGGVTSHTRVQPMLGERLELGVVRAHCFPCHGTTSLWTFTFSHLADFIQSDLQGRHILHFYTDGTLHIRSNYGFSVLLKDASTGNRTSNLLITK